MNPLSHSRVVSIYKGEVKDTIEVIADLQQALANGVADFQDESDSSSSLLSAVHRIESIRLSLISATPKNNIAVWTLALDCTSAIKTAFGAAEE